MTPSSAETRSEYQSEPAKPRWPDWSGKTAVLIATGPSLTAEQVKRTWVARRFNQCRVIAVNEAGLTQYKPLAAPWADILYAADARWWRTYIPEFYGLRVSGEAVEAIEVDGHVWPAVHTVPLKVIQTVVGEMPREPGSVLSGGHSGFQALGLALTLGAARIILLGFDCGGKARNCHTGRPAEFTRTKGAFMNAQHHYKKVVQQWPEVRVYNCSMDSAIDCFEKRRIEDLL